MDGAAELFDAFYTRLVLRDVLGKVLPGSFVLMTIARWWLSPGTIIKSVKTCGVPLLLALLAASWITAFAVQALGEQNLPGGFAFVRYDPVVVNSDFDPAQLRVLLRNNPGYTGQSGFENRLQFERYVVIKEACGNSYAAGLACLSILVCFVAHRGAAMRLDHRALFKAACARAPLFLIAVAGISALRYMHLRHIRKQYEHTIALLHELGGKIPTHQVTFDGQWLSYLGYSTLLIVAAMLIGEITGLIARE